MVAVMTAAGEQLSKFLHNASLRCKLITGQGLSMAISQRVCACHGSDSAVEDNPGGRAGSLS